MCYDDNDSGDSRICQNLLSYILMNMADECLIKFIVLGESGVGKTSLLKLYAGKTGLVKPTVIIDRLQVNTVIQGIKLHIELWDTAGQERFRCITKNLFHNVDGVLLVYDVTDMTSFLKLSSWLLDLKSANDDAICFIVGNKIDDPNRNAVCVNQVRNFAEEEGLELHFCSAQTGENVNETFELLALRVLEHKNIIQPQPESELESSDDSMLATYSVVPPNSSDTIDSPGPDSIVLHEAARTRKKKKKKKDCSI